MTLLPAGEDSVLFPYGPVMLHRGPRAAWQASETRLRLELANRPLLKIRLTENGAPEIVTRV